MFYILKIQPFLHLLWNDIVVFSSSNKWGIFQFSLIIIEIFGNCKKTFLQSSTSEFLGCEATTSSIIISVLSTVRLSKYPECH